MVTAVVTEDGVEIARVEFASAEVALLTYGTMKRPDGTPVYEQVGPTMLVSHRTKHNGVMLVELVGA